MAYQKIEVPAELVQPGDVFVRVKGYSGNLNSGRRVEYEVLAVETGHAFKNSDAPAVLVRLRDRATGKKSSELEHAGRFITVYRKP